MANIAQSGTVSRHKNTKCVDRPSAIGMCLKCGKRLSFCGKPFTDDIRCPNCGAVNQYVESQQPVRIKAA